MSKALNEVRKKVTQIPGAHIAQQKEESVSAQAVSGVLRLCNK